MGRHLSEREIKEIKLKDKKRKLAKEKIRDFLEIHEGNRLIEAYNLLVEANAQGGILYPFFEVGKENGRNLVNEFETEYEIKLNVDYSGITRGATNVMKEIIKRINFLPRFIPGTGVMSRDSVNTFYGRVQKEGLVIINSVYKKQNSLKRKTESAKINLGISGEEFVIARRESIKRNVPDEEIYSAIEKAVLSGERKMGKVRRERARVDFISSFTGRVYEVVFDKCNVYKESGSKEIIKRQFEIEYQGKLIKANSQSEKNLREMVSEIVSFGNLFLINLRGLNIGEGIIKSANFTQERKYDWLIS